MTRADQRSGGLSKAWGAARIPSVPDRREAASTIAAALPILAVAGVCLAIVARRWAQIGELPTGVDGGNWLAIGNALTSRDASGLPNGGIYPPLVPLSMRVFAEPVGEFTAAKLMAVGSLLAVFGSVLLVGRKEAGWWPALLAATATSLSRPINEPVAFGGYPQNFALAGCLLSLWAAAHLLESPSRRWLAATAAAFVVTALSHHMYFAVTLGSCVTLLCLWTLTGGLSLRGLAAFAVAAAAGVAAFLPVALALTSQGYDPPVNPMDATLRESLEYGFRGATLLWLATWAAALAGLGWLILLATRRREHPSPALAASAAMLATATAGLLAVHEARLIPPIAVAAPLAVALIARQLLAWRTHPAAVALAIAAPASLLIALVPRLDSVTQDDFDYYRVLDEPYIAAVDWSRDHPPARSTAVQSDERGWPVGWWWRGLSKEAVVVGSHPRWLAFEDEREHAAVAAAIFGAPTGEEAARIAREHGISRMVSLRPDWMGWSLWQDMGAMPWRVVFHEDGVVVLDLSPP